MRPQDEVSLSSISMCGTDWQMRLVATLLCCSALACSQEASWSARETRILESLSVSRFENAASPSNRFADSAEVAAFGKRLFFEPGLSGNGKLSCASCHDPERAFVDGRPRAVGMGQTQRNTPTLFGVGSYGWFYWDGRRDSLWAQALIPLEAPSEMGASRIHTLRVLRSDPAYAASYRALFGSEVPDTDGIDPRANVLGGSTARAAWAKVPRAKREEVDRAFANVGKALAAYERGLVPQPTRFDRYVAAIRSGNETGAGELTPDEQRGLRLFIDGERTRCLDCHNGPMLTNGSFHNIGTGNFDGPQLDHGRELGVMAVKVDPFNCMGPFSDADPEDCGGLRFLAEAHVETRGAFKVPTLRYLARTGPYMHDGRFASLAEVVAHYERAEPDAHGQSELRPLSLTSDERRSLVAFLRALSP